MEGKQPVPVRQSWWKRQSSRFKLLLAAAILIIVIGLAVGLGVGLTRNNNSGDDNGDDNNPPQTSISPIVPGPNPSSLWQPDVGTSWQIILLYPLNLSSDATSVSPDVDVWDIDMYTNSQQVISTLKRLGKKVVCYFSAGSFESGRPDSNQFVDSDKGSELDGWPGEYWLDLKSDNVRRIMKDRIQYAADKGCDAIDPDNVDGYSNKNGLGLTQADSISFIQYLSSIARPLNLSLGLKNAGQIIPSVLNISQFSVNEQCVQFSECDTFSPFVQAGKPVFNIEYPDGAPNVAQSVVDAKCADTGDAQGRQGFSTIIKKMNLDGWAEFCDKNTVTTLTVPVTDNSPGSDTGA